MGQDTLHIYWVMYKYRRMKQFKTERWKPKYKWQVDTLLVNCRDSFDIGNLIFQHVLEHDKGNSEWEVRIVSVEDPYKKGRANQSM